MFYRVSCPTCGKVVMLNEEAAGGPMLCTACGTRIQVPADPLRRIESVTAMQAASAPSDVATEDPESTLVAPDESAPNEEAATTSYDDLPGALAPARHTVSSVPPSPLHPAPLEGSRTWMIASICALGIVIVAGFTVAIVRVVQHHDQTDTIADASSASQSNADLIGLKTDAERLTSAGKLSEAHEKYRQMQQLAASRLIDDVPTRDMLESARAEQSRIYATLLARAPQPPILATQYAAAAPTTTRDAADAALPAPATAPAVTAAQETSTTQASVVNPSPAPPEPGSPVLPLAAAADAAELERISDGQIGRSMQSGVDFLLAQFQDGELTGVTEVTEAHRQALHAMCVYSLLQASQALKDERLNVRGKLMQDLIEKMKSHPMATDGTTTNQPMVYGRSFRAAALAVYNRPEDRKALKADVDWLVSIDVDGAYSYDDGWSKLLKAGQRPQLAGPANDRGPGVPGGSGPAVSPQVDDGPPVESPPPPPIDSPPPPPVTGGPSGPPPSTVPPGGSIPPGTVIPPGSSGPPGRGGPVRVVPGRSGAPRGIDPRILVAPQPRLTQVPRYKVRPEDTGLPNQNGNTVPRIPPQREGGVPVDPRQRYQNPFEFPWDNSNSQYALLGVWAGAEVGVEVPERYWKRVEQHWLSCELKTGEWGYHAHESQGYLSMTCAGIASLMVTHDYIDAPLLHGAVGREPFSKNLAAGFAWLEQGDHGVGTPNPKTHYMGYDLYGLERVGLASGFKYLGTHDWYRELAQKVVAMQHANGAWGYEDHGQHALADTSYTLLFLARGRHPVLMNKLRFDKYWMNRPRDLANLSRFASQQLERPFNWQVVNLKKDWWDWMDSPVLYIASQEALQLDDSEYEKLRHFVEAGGMIFTHADAGQKAFSDWVPELVKKVCPGYELQKLPDDHVIYSVQYPIKPPHVALQGVSNGTRLLLVHSPGDLAAAWQQRSDKVYRDNFRLGINIFVYAAGKRDFRNRLNSPYIPTPPGAPRDTVQVARLRYGGGWDPEPAAWQRFSRYFQWETNQGVNTATIDLHDLKPGAARIAHLTGNGAHDFTPADSAALRSYVEAGGVLLIDSAGGSDAFTKSIQNTLVPTAFTGSTPEPLPAEHPLFQDIPRRGATPMRLRPYATDKLGNASPTLTLLKLGNGYVLISQLDLTTALLGTNTWGILGYDPASAQHLIKNLLIWAEAPGKEQQQSS